MQLVSVMLGPLLKYNTGGLNKNMTSDNSSACGLARHYGNYHRQDMDTYISRLEVTMVDSFEEEKDLKRLEDR